MDNKEVYINRLSYISVIIVFLCSLFSILLAFLQNVNDANTFLLRLRAFTNLSNLLVFLFYAFNLYVILFNKKLIYSRAFARLKFITVMGITLTFVIFGLLLAPLNEIFHYGFKTFMLRSVMAHFVVPPLTLIDYFFFDMSRVNKKESFLSLIFPISYYIIVMIIGGFINSYPYFFMDYKQIGFFFEGGSKPIKVGVIPFFFIILIVFTFLSLLIYYLKNKKVEKDLTK